MLNNSYTILYGLVEPPPSGIETELTANVAEIDVLRAVKLNIPESQDAAGYDKFAISCLKVLDGSIYEDSARSIDDRITYNIAELTVDTINFEPFMSRWLSLPAASIQKLLTTDEYKTSYRGSLTQEAVAALIASYVEQTSEHNG